MKNLIVLLILFFAAVTAFSQCYQDGYSKGWYSKGQAQVGGVNMWITTEGDTVLTTEISKDSLPSGTWDDYIYVGQVCQFIKKVSDGTLFSSYAIQFPPSKNILDYMREYKEWCDEEVEIEVGQYGTVTEKFIPVKNQNEAIVEYTKVPVDTIWQAVECPEYKEVKRYNSLLYYSSSDTTYTITRVVPNYAPVIDLSQPYRITITRPATCVVKRRELDWDRFFEWLAEKL